MNFKKLTKRVSDAQNEFEELESKIRQCVKGITKIEFKDKRKQRGGVWAYVYTKNVFTTMQQLESWSEQTGAFDIEVDTLFSGEKGFIYLFFWQM
jgi:hypothetical protein